MHLSPGLAMQPRSWLGSSFWGLHLFFDFFDKQQRAKESCRAENNNTRRGEKGSAIY